MMTKTAYYMQMAQEAAAQITGSKEQWTAFLTTSARLYKYAKADLKEAFWYSMTAQTCGISIAHGTDETVCVITYFLQVFLLTSWCLASGYSKMKMQSIAKQNQKCRIGLWHKRSCRKS